jgi:hypothetical protein
MPFFVVQCVKRRPSQLVAAPRRRLLVEGIQQQRLRSKWQVSSLCCCALRLSPEGSVHRCDKCTTEACQHWVVNTWHSMGILDRQ